MKTFKILIQILGILRKIFCFDQKLLDFVHKSSFDRKSLRFVYNYFRTRSSSFWTIFSKNGQSIDQNFWDYDEDIWEIWPKFLRNCSKIFKKIERNLCNISQKTFTNFAQNIETLTKILEKIDKNIRYNENDSILIQINILVKIWNIFLKISKIVFY